jgi:translocation and assembly module TamB
LNGLPGLPSLAGQRLAIGRLALGERVLGENASFTIEGRLKASDPAGGIEAYLRADGIDGPKATAEVTVAVKGANPNLFVHAKAQEPGGTLLSAALRADAPAPASLELFGEGPLDAWGGRLKADVVSFGALDAAVTLKVPNGLTVATEGTITVAPRLLRVFP